MEAVAIQKHEEHKEKIRQVYKEVAKVVVGQEYMVNRPRSTGRSSRPCQDTNN